MFLWRNWRLPPPPNFSAQCYGKQRSICFRIWTLRLYKWEIIFDLILPAMWTWVNNWNSLRLTSIICKMLLIAKQDVKVDITTWEVKRPNVLLDTHRDMNTDIDALTELYVNIYFTFILHTHIYYIYILTYIYIFNFVFTFYEYIHIHAYVCK